MNERCRFTSNRCRWCSTGFDNRLAPPAERANGRIPGRDSHRCKRNIGHSQLDLPAAPIDEYRDSRNFD